MAICNSAVLAYLLAKPLASFSLLPPFLPSLSLSLNNMHCIFLRLSLALSLSFFVFFYSDYLFIPTLLTSPPLPAFPLSTKDAAGFSFPQLAHSTEGGGLQQDHCNAWMSELLSLTIYIHTHKHTLLWAPDSYRSDID